MDYETFKFLRTKYLIYQARLTYIQTNYNTEDVDVKIMVSRLEELIKRFKVLVARRENQRIYFIG